MAEHGYARDYDEPIGRDDDDDRGRWRDENRGGWRGEDRGRGRRDEQHEANERNRNFMLGDRDRSWERDTRDEDWNRSGSGMNHYGRSQSNYGRSGDDQRGFGGGADWERSPRTFGSNQDDHYRSWRDRQMSALDRDYQDYCREREEQFHRDFDSWRQNRQQRGGQPRNEEMQEEIERERSHDRAATEGGTTPSGVGAATVGTNNSENTGIGRGKPQV